MFTRGHDHTRQAVAEISLTPQAIDVYKPVRPEDRPARHGVAQGLPCLNALGLAPGTPPRRRPRALNPLAPAGPTALRGSLGQAGEVCRGAYPIC